jgi:hypothetical protein
MDGAGSGQRMALASRSWDLDVSDRFVFNAESEVADQHSYRGGEVNRGIIGAIIGILVIIILVIVILQMT